jgi:hypothetical protein
MLQHNESIGYPESTNCPIVMLKHNLRTSAPSSGKGFAARDPETIASDGRDASPQVFDMKQLPTPSVAAGETQP